MECSFLLGPSALVVHKSPFPSLSLVKFISAHVYEKPTVDHKQALCCSLGIQRWIEEQSQKRDNLKSGPNECGEHIRRTMVQCGRRLGRIILSRGKVGISGAPRKTSGRGLWVLKKQNEWGRTFRAEVWRHVLAFDSYCHCGNWSWPLRKAQLSKASLPS